MDKKLTMVSLVVLLFFLLIPAAYADTAATTTDTSTTSTDNAATSDTSTTSSGTSADTTTPAAPTLTSADFQDLSGLSDDLKKEFDFVLGKGIMNGMSDGTFGLNQPMNRAQFAKVAALTFGLPVDTTLTTSSFTDVKADDPANGYALPYIEALKKAGLTNGYNKEGTLYNPSGQVSREQLAVFLIRGLGWEDQVQTVAPIMDSSVDDWASRYVALALQKQIMTNLGNGQFGGMSPASRETLVTAAYQSFELDKLAIVSVKQIGAAKVVMSFNKVVPTTAQLAIQQDNMGIPGTTVWADDGKSATINLNTKLLSETYQAVVTGVDADELAVGSVDFQGQAEKSKTIAFNITGDTLPKGKVNLGLKATNQFGEPMQLTAVNLRITSSVSGDNTFNPAGQFMTVDLNDATLNTKVFISVVDITSGASAHGTFTLGTKPMVSKLEVGDAEYPQGVTKFLSGGTVYFPITAYDQYGNPITNPDVLNSGVIAWFSDPNDLLDDSGNYFVDRDRNGKLYFQLSAIPDPKGDKTIDIKLIASGGGQPVDKSIDLYAKKEPASVSFPTFTNNLHVETCKITNPDDPTDVCEGTFIDLEVKDSLGNQLTNQQIVDAYNAGDFTIFASGGITLADPAIASNIDPSKNGRLEIIKANLAGPATVYIRVNATNNTFKLPMTIQGSATLSQIGVKPDEDTDPLITNDNVTLFSGSHKTLYLAVRDQYGNEVSSTSGYDVVGTITLTSGTTDAANNISVGSNNYRYNSEEKLPSVYTWQKPLSKFVGGRQFAIKANPASIGVGTFKITFTLVKVDSDDNITDTLNTAIVNLNIVDPANANLTFSLDAPDQITAAGTILYNNGLAPSVTNATYLFSAPGYQDWYQAFWYNNTAQIKGTDVAGNDAKIGSDQFPIKAMSTDQPTVVGFEYEDNGQVKIVGLKPGTANVTATFTTPGGDVMSVSKTIQVLDAPLSIKEVKSTKDYNEISLDESGNEPDLSTVLDGKYIWDDSLAGDIQAIDQNNDPFTNKMTTDDDGNIISQDEISPVNRLIGFTAFISNITYMNPEADDNYKDSVYIDGNYQLHYKRGEDREATDGYSIVKADLDHLPYNITNIKSFVINIIANGHLKQIPITIDHKSDTVFPPRPGSDYTG